MARKRHSAEKIAYEVRTEGREFELDPHVTIRLDREVFTVDEVDIIMGLARRLASSDR